MAENYIYDNVRGVIIPDTADIKTAVQDEWKTAIGQDLVLDDDTPQGQLIDAETLSRSSVIRNNAQVANQINPNLAGGVWLDAVCAWLGIVREGAASTFIPGCVLTGQAKTFIPAGSRARTKNGDEARAINDVLLDDNGQAIADFEIVATGPIAVPAHYLIKIVDSIFGWETIDNPNDGVLGRDQQSDESLRQVRALRLAQNAISTVEAQISGLYAIPGVKSLQFRENISDQYQTIDGIYMKPHSVWACVFGGADDAIAASLLKNKTDGAGWNGEQSLRIIEPNANIPYLVQWDRAEVVTVSIRVTVSRGQSTANPTDAVRNAIVQYANGEIPGERGFVVGVDISPFELSGAVNHFEPGLFVRKVECARSGEPLAAQLVPIATNEIGQTTANNIVVVIV